MDNPIKKLIKITQRSGSLERYILVAHQNISVEKQSDADHTEASTAENQKESAKIKLTAPINALPKTAYMADSVSSPFCVIAFLAKKLIDQNRNRIVSELNTPQLLLIIGATLCTSPKLKSDTTCWNN